MADFPRNAMHFKKIRSGWLKQKFRFQIVAGNGRILCTSESYHNEDDCEATIESIKRSAAYAPVLHQDGTVPV